MTRISPVKYAAGPKMRAAVARKAAVVHGSEQASRNGQVGDDAGQSRCRSAVSPRPSANCARRVSLIFAHR